LQNAYPNIHPRADARLADSNRQRSNALLEIPSCSLLSGYEQLFKIPDKTSIFPIVTAMALILLPLIPVISNYPNNPAYPFRVFREDSKFFGHFPPRISQIFDDEYEREEHTQFKQHAEAREALCESLNWRSDFLNVQGMLHREMQARGASRGER